MPRPIIPAIYSSLMALIRFSKASQSNDRASDRQEFCHPNRANHPMSLGRHDVKRQIKMLGQLRPCRFASSRGAITLSIPAKVTPRRINGITVAGRSGPCAKPQAATVPPYLVCAMALAKVWLPTASTTPAHCSLSNGRPFPTMCCGQSPAMRPVRSNRLLLPCDR